MIGQEIGAIIEQMRTAATSGTPGAGAGRPEVAALAAQFESMLLAQMLRDMRQAGRWSDESEERGLGAGTYLETLHLELANYLGGSGGLGLQAQLLEAFERATGLPAPAAVAAPAAALPAAVTAGRPPAARNAPDAAALTAAATGLEFAVAPATVTSPFGWRSDPITGRQAFHRGIDIRAAYGDDVHAVRAGTVVVSGEQGSYGQTVVVDHGNGVRTRYAHLSATAVQSGDPVAAGQLLGHAGRSGRATGTHLHFEVTVDGKPVSPIEAGLMGAHGR